MLCGLRVGLGAWREDKWPPFSHAEYLLVHKELSTLHGCTSCWGCAILVGTMWRCLQALLDTSVIRGDAWSPYGLKYITAVLSEPISKQHTFSIQNKKYKKREEPQDWTWNTHRGKAWKKHFRIYLVFWSLPYSCWDPILVSGYRYQSIDTWYRVSGNCKIPNQSFYHIYVLGMFILPFTWGRNTRAGIFCIIKIYYACIFR